MGSDNPNIKGQPGLTEAALFALCPRCGAKGLFSGMIRFSDRCAACGLDYIRFNVGDGPAAFLTLLIGGLGTVLAIWLQLAASPPFWVHIILWIPLTTAAVVLGLRAAKAGLLYTEFTRKAGEAVSDSIEGDGRSASAQTNTDVS